jgi:hypothetical protein
VEDRLWLESGIERQRLRSLKLEQVPVMAGNTAQRDGHKYLKSGGEAEIVVSARAVENAPEEKLFAVQRFSRSEMRPITQCCIMRAPRKASLFRWCPASLADRDGRDEESHKYDKK